MVKGLLSPPDLPAPADRPASAAWDSQGHPLRSAMSLFASRFQCYNFLEELKNGQGDFEVTAYLTK